jgi:glutathione gamma-glutamylcysteinyltransferase
MEKNSEAFFTLVQQFITQSSPSTCASATMAMILNSLQIDPKVNWKGIWRWYDDFNIQQMQQRHLSDGLTLEEYDQLIRLNQTKSMAFSPLLNLELAQSTTLKQSSATLFRSCISACTRRSNLLLTLNFHRKSLGQTGDGHFSPVAAYNSKRDLALILDVAKFKYDSYWCPVEQLYEALKPFDKVSNQSRGFLINKKRYEYEEQPESPLCYL